LPQCIVFGLQHKDFLYLLLYTIWHARILSYFVDFILIDT
jgi:hypothetical protein